MERVGSHNITYGNCEWNVLARITELYGRYHNNQAWLDRVSALVRARPALFRDSLLGVSTVLDLMRRVAWFQPEIPLPLFEAQTSAVAGRPAGHPSSGDNIDNVMSGLLGKRLSTLVTASSLPELVERERTSSVSIDDFFVKLRNGSTASRVHEFPIVPENVSTVDLTVGESTSRGSSDEADVVLRRASVWRVSASATLHQQVAWVSALSKKA